MTSADRLRTAAGIAPACLLSILGIAAGAVSPTNVELPGAVVSFVFYGVVGCLAVRGYAWARWLTFALLTLTAITCLLFTFVSLGSGNATFEFAPALAAVSLAYVGGAVLLAWPCRGVQLNT